MCGPERGLTEKSRETIWQLFRRGKVKIAVAHRYAVCCQPRLCPNLVKSLGTNSVGCTTNYQARTEPDEKWTIVPLYEALADPNFKCPRGWF